MNARHRFGHAILAIGIAVISHTTCLAENAAQTFAWRTPLVTSTAGLQRLTLPPAAYEAMLQANLADLRVFNAAGETVPIARVERLLTTAQTTSFSAPLFGLPQPAAIGQSDTQVRIERRSDGSLISITSNTASKQDAAAEAWIVDASSHREPLSALVLELPESAAAVDTRLSIEASDDLATWRMVESSVPIIRLIQEGAKLQRNRVELHGVRAAYLRLRWQAPAPGIAPTSVTLETMLAAEEARRDWKALAPARQESGEYGFTSPGLYPVDRLRVHLPNLNTVVPVSIWSRAYPSQPWRQRASAVAFRLASATGEQTSPDIMLPNVRDPLWQLRVDQRGGGLGSQALQIELGWVPEQIVFAARGSPPFSLAAGNRNAPSSLYPVTTLLADIRPETIAVLPEAQPAAVEAAAQPKVARDRSANSTPWLLWGVLLGAVVLLGGMARSLLREMSNKRNND